MSHRQLLEDSEILTQKSKSLESSLASLLPFKETCDNFNILQKSLAKSQKEMNSLEKQLAECRSESILFEIGFLNTELLSRKETLNENSVSQRREEASLDSRQKSVSKLQVKERDLIAKRKNIVTKVPSVFSSRFALPIHPYTRSKKNILRRGSADHWKSFRQRNLRRSQK